MRNELFHTHTYLFIHGAGDAQGRRRHDDLQLPDQVPVLTIESPYKKQIKICTIKTFLIKLAKVRDTLANLLENRVRLRGAAEMHRGEHPSPSNRESGEFHPPEA